MRIGTYACGGKRCAQPHWNAALPSEVRQATGMPVACPRCGRVARLLAVIHQPEPSLFTLNIAAVQGSPAGWIVCFQDGRSLVSRS